MMSRISAEVITAAQTGAYSSHTKRTVTINIASFYLFKIAIPSFADKSTKTTSQAMSHTFVENEIHSFIINKQPCKVKDVDGTVRGGLCFVVTGEGEELPVF